MFETRPDGETGGAQAREAGPHVVVEGEVLAAAPGVDDGRRAAGDRLAARRLPWPSTIASAMISWTRVVVGVAALGATRLDGLVGAPLGLVPPAGVEAQAEAGARRAVARGAEQRARAAAR